MKYFSIAMLATILFFAGSCSKKSQPLSTTGSTAANTEAAKAAAAKRAARKLPVADIITVDDRAAKKTPDGRLYYDYNGKRYWRNYDDGKYYRFNKKMYNDPAFKPH